MREIIIKNKITIKSGLMKFMDSVTLHRFKIPLKGVKKKIIYHFSDLHLTEFDELSDEAEAEKAKISTREWERIRREFAEDFGEPYGEAQKQSGKIHFQNLMNVAKDGDALVLAGDIIDFPNMANMRLVEKMLVGAQLPVLFVCGNHDGSGEIPQGFIYSSVIESVKKLVLDDLVLLGFNNSERKITVEQNEFLEAELKNAENVIIAMHIPMASDENAEIFSKISDYFKINYDGAPKENFRFCEIIKQNSKKIAAVLAGHTHFMSAEEIAPDVMQYISSQGITGHINRYEIGE